MKGEGRATPRRLVHHPQCMGCGSENPAGIGAHYWIAGDGVEGRVRFDERQSGAPGFAHGGAIATVLDDLLGSLLFVLERPAVTANLSVDFRAPAYLGRKLDLRAWCAGIDGRKLDLRGEVLDEGRVVATGAGLFLEVELSHWDLPGKSQPLTEGFLPWQEGAAGAEPRR